MIRINAIFDEPFLAKLTEAAKAEHVSRSELIRKAVADYLQRRQETHFQDKRNKNLSEAFMVQDALRQKSGGWDGVAAIRRWRDAV